MCAAVPTFVCPRPLMVLDRVWWLGKASFYIPENVQNSLPGPGRVNWNCRSQKDQEASVQNLRHVNELFRESVHCFSLELFLSNPLLCWRQIMSNVCICRLSALLYSIFPKSFKLKSFFLKGFIKFYYQALIPSNAQCVVIGIRLERTN